MTEANGHLHKTEPKSKKSTTSWFQLPPALRSLFDKFPLQTHATNSLPQRAPRRRDQHVLYLFAGSDGSGTERPSYNPSCLKWQAYLKFQGIDFVTHPSNNHASPTGSLPFLIRATSSPDRPSSPVSTNKMTKWATSQTGLEDSVHFKEEVYASLISHSIRNAWLYNLYLDDANFEAVAWPLYIATDTNNPVVQHALAHQLKSAARDELLKSYIMIDPSEIYRKSYQAFEALSVLLEDDSHFFGSENPTLFDASVFAYTQLLLDERLQWQSNVLGKQLLDFPGLVEHRDRLFQMYFDG